jgi:septal ring factor EnvC (AmiA/AmiB activator)
MGVPIPFSRLMVMLLIGGLSACTTTNDVERLDHTVTRKLDALTTTMKEELKDLKSIQRAQDKRQEDLTKSVDALKTVIYANVEAMGRSYESLDRSTKRLVESLKTDLELQQHLLADHQRFETTVGGLTPLATSLDQQVQRLTDILRESYKTELLGLRERLRILEGVANPTSQSRSDSSGISPVPSDASRKSQAKRD